MKTYKLFTNPAELKEISRDIWSEEYINGKLTTEDQSYKVKFSFRGHQIRKHRKKSYTVLFVKPWYKDGVHEIHLNAEYKDPSLIRNKLSMDFFNHIGVFAPETEHVLLYLNGTFKGIYLQLESIDEQSLKKRNLPAGPIFYATNNDANFSLLTAEGDAKPSLDEGYTQKTGTKDDLDYLIELMVKINTLSTQEFNKEINKYIHIEKYFNWLTGAVCTQNFDGFVHNYALYRNSHTGLFEISPWDYDGTWGRDIHGDELSMDYVPLQGYNTLTARLLNCNNYRQAYKQRLTHVLKNEFTVDYLSPIIRDIFEELAPFISKDPHTKNRVDAFHKEYQFIIQFIEDRNRYLTQQLSSLA